VFSVVPNLPDNLDLGDVCGSFNHRKPLKKIVGLNHIRTDCHWFLKMKTITKIGTSISASVKQAFTEFGIHVHLSGVTLCFYGGNATIDRLLRSCHREVVNTKVKH